MHDLVDSARALSGLSDHLHFIEEGVGTQAKQPCKSHTAGTWQSWDCRLGLSDPYNPFSTLSYHPLSLLVSSQLGRCCLEAEQSEGVRRWWPDQNFTSVTCLTFGQAASPHLFSRGLPPSPLRHYPEGQERKVSQWGQK